MSKTTIPIFIVGSGRSGTRMMYKLLSGIPHIEIYHEFVCTHIQPLAAKYFMGLINKEELKKEILRLHGSAIHYSEAKYWVDSSNKLSWIIGPLYDMFPNAKFIHIMRDGRRVVSSFYHKLSSEIYDDTSVKIMTDWLNNPDKLPEPPPEKKYWWNIPQKGQPFYKDFPSFNQFERICYHWTEVIRVINKAFKNIPKKQKFEIKLEDLVSNKNALKRFLTFFEVEYKEHFFEYLKRPQNVFFPMNFDLTMDELKSFNKIAGETLRMLGYKEKKAYIVNY